MLAIPFGLVGALIGHFLMGFDLSLVSLFGVVALSGVVVKRLLGVGGGHQPPAGARRGFGRGGGAGRASAFSTILLTSLTTFFGLVPMILEPSLQARFLIPMAVSLAFGVLFSTFIIYCWFLRCTWLWKTSRGFRSLLWPGARAARIEHARAALNAALGSVLRCGASDLRTPDNHNNSGSVFSSNFCRGAAISVEHLLFDRFSVFDPNRIGSHEHRANFERHKSSFFCATFHAKKNSARELHRDPWGAASCLL